MNPRPTVLRAALTVAAAIFVAWGIVSPPGRSAWAVVLGLVAMAAWVLQTGAAMVGWRRTAVALALIGAVTGAAAAAGTDGTAVVAAAICVSILVADETVPVPFSALVGLVCLGLVAGGAIVRPMPPLSLAAFVAAIVLGWMGGLSRRQRRSAVRREELLRERDAAAREEASRIALARDLHDVLAHTLGGLVIQLDAVDALLEAGDEASARIRVASARELAGAGLGEARRAVAALRAPAAASDQPDVTAAALRASLADLVSAHRSLGGEVELTETGEPVSVSAELAAALQRAVQEALSNARRHAPGAPVTVRLIWHEDSVALSVANPAAGAGARGGGYGLVGMGERFAALPLGGSLTAGRAEGMFTLTAEARTR